MGNQSSTECSSTATPKVDGVRAKGVSLLTTAEDIEEWAEWLPDSLEKRKKTKDSDTSAAQRHVDWEDENIVTKETKVWFIFGQPPNASSVYNPQNASSVYITLVAELGLAIIRVALPPRSASAGPRTTVPYRQQIERRHRIHTFGFCLTQQGATHN
jgi:hypothetical protein